MQLHRRLGRLIIAGNAALALTLLLALPASAQVTVTVNGSEVGFSSAPMIQDGRVFVPLRGVFERLGASVDYANGAITATGDGGRTIALHIGSTQATIDGQPETIDVAPFIVGQSTFVPLRFISQALGASVNWDNTDRVVSISLAGAPQDVSYAAPSNDEYADYAPPPIPQYDQPDVPAQNEIWQPGYWAWGSYGYYWVPGTWVEAPQTGYLWTPGYWAWNNGRYAWNPGYWATTVGFYGGVNYGSGYSGNGYDGGRWDHDSFRYNTYVTRVNVTVVKNVYVDRTVYVNTAPAHVAYNGGPHGIAARPNAQQQTAAQAPHIGMTPVQRQHAVVASQDRRFLATVNHDQPPVTAVTRPLSTINPPAALVPIKPSDRVVPPVRAAPVERAMPQAAAPQTKETPQDRIAPAVHVAPPVQVVTPAAQPAAPERRVPEQAAPERVAPPVRAAPVATAVPVARPVVPVARPAAPVRVAPPLATAPPAARLVAPVHAIPAARPVAPVPAASANAVAPAAHPAPAAQRQAPPMHAVPSARPSARPHPAAQ